MSLSISFQERPFPSNTKPQRESFSEFVQGNQQAFYNQGIYWIRKGVTLKNQNLSTDEFHKAFFCFQESARLNGSICLNEWGWLYSLGNGVKKNLKIATYFFLAGAFRGDSLALSSLGFCYLTGTGLDKDKIKAASCYKLSADLGSIEACRVVGQWYEHGVGVLKNQFKAVEYYQKGADLGDSEALYNLGVCYQQGKGVPKNREIAKQLFKQASHLGHMQAQEKYLLLSKTRPSLQAFSSKSIAQTPKKASCDCLFVLFRIFKKKK